MQKIPCCHFQEGTLHQVRIVCAAVALEVSSVTETGGKGAMWPVLRFDWPSRISTFLVRAQNDHLVPDWAGRAVAQHIHGPTNYVGSSYVEGFDAERSFLVYDNNDCNCNNTTSLSQVIPRLTSDMYKHHGHHFLDLV